MSTIYRGMFFKGVFLISLFAEGTAWATAVNVSNGNKWNIGAGVYEGYGATSDNGGYLFNSGTVTVADGAEFKSNVGWLGGAIHNTAEQDEPLSVMNNVALSADDTLDNGRLVFDGGVAFDSNSAAYGGAIYNAYGDIIFNDGASATFKGNHAEGDYTVSGGAIYNSNGTLQLVDSSFENNSAETTGYSAEGGAIYNYEGDVSIAAVNKDVLFQGNYTSYIESVPASVDINPSAAGDRIITNNAICSAGGSLSLSAVGGHNVRFEDEIDGSGYSVSVGGNNGDVVHGVLNDYVNTMVYSRDDLGLSEVVFNSKVLGAKSFDLSGSAAVRFGKGAYVSVWDYTADDSILTLDMAIDAANQKVKNSLIEVANDVSGTTNVIVNAENPEVFEGAATMGLSAIITGCWR